MPQPFKDPGPEAPTDPVLELRVQREGDRVVVSAIGEVDLATAPRLRACLDDAVSSGAQTVSVDMSRLDFIDSVGLTVLIEVAQAAEANQIGFALRSPQRATHKVLAFSGLTDLLTIEDLDQTDRS